MTDDGHGAGLLTIADGEAESGYRPGDETLAEY